MAAFLIVIVRAAVLKIHFKDLLQLASNYVRLFRESDPGSDQAFITSGILFLAVINQILLRNFRTEKKASSPRSVTNHNILPPNMQVLFS